MRGFRQWKWHLNEGYVKINGEMHYLWRAVDQEGGVLESYVTKTRDSTTTSTSNATPSIERPACPVARPHWPSGTTSWPETCASKRQLGRSETI
ncbi:MAG: DDE-type integrase/transposase/recombinase [Croceibacterium sp.]